MLICFSVAGSVAIEPDVVAILNEDAIFVRKNAQRHDQTVDKNTGLGSGVAVWLVVDQHLVLATCSKELARTFRILIGIDRILGGRHGPHPSCRIECDRHELADPFRLGRHQFDLKTVRNRESPPFLLRRADIGLNVELGANMGQGPFLCGRFFFCFRLFGSGDSDLLPRRCIRRRRQLLNGHVLHLNQHFAAAVRLNTDVTVERDVGVRFGVVEGRHIIDPRTNTSTLCPNAICVPAVFLDNLVDGSQISRLTHNFVPTRFVIQLTPPTVARIHLVADHLRTVGLSHAPDLNARIDEAFGSRDANFQAQIKIIKRFFGGEKSVVGNTLRQRAARDRAVDHVPPRTIGVKRLPSIERFAVE